MEHTVCQTAICSILLNTKTLVERTSLVLRTEKQPGNKSLHFRLYPGTGNWTTRQNFRNGGWQIFRAGQLSFRTLRAAIICENADRIFCTTGCGSQSCRLLGPSHFGHREASYSRPRNASGVFLLDVLGTHPKRNQTRRSSYHSENHGCR